MSSQVSTSASKMYEIAKGVATGTQDIEITMGAAVAILIIGIHYMIVSTMGLRTHAGCGALKDNKVYDNLSKYLSYTLTIAITIPLTLMLQKAFSKDVPAWLAFFGLMGLIASSINLNLTQKCDNAGKRTKQFAISGLVSYVSILIVGVMMLLKKSAPIA